MATLSRLSKSDDLTGRRRSTCEADNRHTGWPGDTLILANTIFFLPHRLFVAGQRVNFSLARSVIEQLLYLVVQIPGDLSF